VTFHWKLSCSLKNSRNAGSPDSSRRARGGGGSFPGESTDRLFSAAEVGEERQICARRPSTWRRPLRIRPWSKDERLSKARTRRDSIFGSVAFLGDVLIVRLFSGELLVYGVCVDGAREKAEDK
jgi:hypothetical protein